MFTLWTLLLHEFTVWTFSTCSHSEHFFSARVHSLDILHVFTSWIFFSCMYTQCGRFARVHIVDILFLHKFTVCTSVFCTCSQRGHSARVRITWRRAGRAGRTYGHVHFAVTAAGGGHGDDGGRGDGVSIVLLVGRSGGGGGGLHGVQARARRPVHRREPNLNVVQLLLA